MYQYLRQPPSFLDPFCNPYTGIAELRVQCQVSVPSSEAAVVEILWFYNDQQITGSFPAMIELSPIETTGERRSITSTIVLDGDTFNDTYQGRYYCQIAVDGGNFIAPSNTLVLEAEPEIGYPCRGGQEQFSADVVCAGIESPATTTTVAEGTFLAPETTDMTTAVATQTATFMWTTITSPVLPENSLVLTYVLIAIATVFGTIILSLVAGMGIVYWKRKTARELRCPMTDS